MFDRVSLENTRLSPRSLSMNSIIVDLMQQRKFEVHTPFRFEAVDPGTKTAREWATYATCMGIEISFTWFTNSLPWSDQAAKSPRRNTPHSERILATKYY